MATIPIEIILQDAEAPVGPTPTPEETNIVVPDTGAGTVGSGSTFSSSSAASIILPAILLVVALATICTVLVHKHRKHQNDKLSKKEKFATVASSTIAILAATVLVGNLVIPATSAATSIAPGTAELETEDKITIIATREQDSDTITTTVKDTSYATANLDFGYKVTASMAEGTTTANLYLDGNTDSPYYIAPVSDGILTDNTWGYTLTEPTEESSYLSIPLSTKPTNIVKEVAKTVEDTAVDIYYTVQIDKDMPNGTYTGELEYTISPAIEYMQDFANLSAEDKSGLLRSMTEDQQYYLKDNRDDKTYRIAKLKDGNIWMTQNLDLQKEDLLEGVSIDNNNTDNPIASFILPDSQTSGDESWGDSDSEAAVNSLHIYDVAGSGKTYYYCTDPQPWGCQAWGTDPIPVSEFGNYYNWHTATAGTGTYSLTSNEIASGSLCPSGWRLPNGGNYGVAIDLSNLLYEYGILQSRTSNDYDSSKLDDIYGSPLYLGRAGAYVNGVIGAGAVGNVWYSMAEDTLKAQSMEYGSKQLFPWGHPYSSENKTGGYSVRCLAY